MNTKQSIEDYIARRTPWNYLPNEVQECLGNERGYVDEMKKYCFEHRLSYKKSGTESYMKEYDYYREMVSYLKKNLLLFPYQFSSFLKTKLGVVPFTYYHDVLSDLLRSERSYDTLPNFTAADTNRLIGVSRNEYIDIINRARSKKWAWKFNKTSAIKDLLPKEVIPSFKCEYWWEASLVRSNLPSNLNEFVKFFNSLTESEQEAMTLFFPKGFRQPTEQDLLNSNNNSNDSSSIGHSSLKDLLGTKDIKVKCYQFKKEPLYSLYRKNLIFFDVPVHENDYIMVPTLQNFIMNRKPTDYFERIVYDILVTIDERTTLQEISNILDVPIHIVQEAVSLCLRCHFAFKKKSIPKEFQKFQQHQQQEKKEEGEGSSSSSSSTSLMEWMEDIQLYHTVLKSKEETWNRLKEDKWIKKKRVAFIFDNSLTAHLMFGNLGNEIKKHAVTLFEIGKLTDEAMETFLESLDTVKLPKETIGEASVYYTHAICLRNTIRFLRKNELFFYTSSEEDKKGKEKEEEEEEEKMNPNKKRCFDSSKFDGGIDLLRCESLKHLDPPTKLKILKTNYELILTQAPLRCSNTTLPIGMPHFFGPPLSLMFSTPWFRLFLFEKAECGPLTLIFRKGYRVNVLPECFNPSQQKEDNEDNERIIFVNWEMSEPSFVKNHMILQTINESLLFNPVILHQIHSFSSNSSKYKIIKVGFPYVEEDNALEEEEEDVKKQINFLMKKIIKELHLEYSFGVVHFLLEEKEVQPQHNQQEEKKKENEEDRKIIKVYPFDIDFGIPFENEKLNTQIQENIVKKKLLSKEQVEQHDLQMKMLAQDFIQFLDKYIGNNFDLQQKNLLPTRNLFFDGLKYINFEE